MILLETKKYINFGLSPNFIHQSLSPIVPVF